LDPIHWFCLADPDSDPGLKTWVPGFRPEQREVCDIVLVKENIEDTQIVIGKKCRGFGMFIPDPVYSIPDPGLIPGQHLQKK
jgi:hypothetical protein